MNFDLPPVPAVKTETEDERRRRVELGLENVSSETREGRAACLAIIGSEYGRDVEKMYRHWAADVAEKWHGLDVLTPKITKFAGDWFLRWNKNPLTPKNYDELRRVLNRLGYLGPNDYRTQEEKLSEIVENASLDDRDFRKALAQQTREIVEGKKG